ncbi:MAG: hypothetical protein V4670_12140 [Bacteroidota bacterium]
MKKNEDQPKNLIPDFSKKEMQDKAKLFMKKHFKIRNKICEVCKSTNCINNDTCIVCNLTF